MLGYRLLPLLPLPKKGETILPLASDANVRRDTPLISDCIRESGGDAELYPVFLLVNGLGS